MAIPTHSREAEAARRFLEASRNVDQAFRAAQQAAFGDLDPARSHGAAQSRLDLALDELARAEALFDSVTRVQGRRRTQAALDA
ncbi:MULTISPECIES: hypothetical protein [unclassified Paraburkholderia]|uniref:hypothetical protein n=1 Tax=unclassified Paraburkholderia TaxID=2615204 RepID=UPI00286EC677|nr:MULTISPECIES: hypothetical protein [unclassified Paraburkholderia]